MQTTLFYIHDPMCSWCWGYRPTWQKLKAALPASVEVKNLLGGLAADNEQAMPIDMQQTIASHWHKIQSLLGTEFNFDFWSQCKPRRDTYKACRAVLAAANQGREEDMIEAIQRAYYLRAMNPSEIDTLVHLAVEQDLDEKTFQRDLTTGATDNKFRDQRQQTRYLGANSFPSLVLATNHTNKPIALNYTDYRVSLDEILALIL
ncbi:MAG: DsbA family protein [Xanthomonadales bacterium]|nr:DsbA family protein [Xanthomonadales bacterium]